MRKRKSVTGQPGWASGSADAGGTATVTLGGPRGGLAARVANESMPRVIGEGDQRRRREGLTHRYQPPGGEVEIECLSRN